MKQRVMTTRLLESTQNTVCLLTPDNGQIIVGKRDLHKYNDLYYVGRMRSSSRLIHIYNSTVTEDGIVKNKRDSQRFREDEAMFDEVLKYNTKARMVNCPVLGIENYKIVMTGTKEGCTELIIPNVVTGFEKAGSLFMYCHNTIKKVSIYANITALPYKFLYGLNIEEVMLPETLTDIGVFSISCTDIRSIDIPKSVKKIDNSAFFACRMLESITFNGHMSYIGKEAFSFCQALKSIKLPNGISTIFNGTFDNCLALKGVIIPMSVQKVEPFAFSNCCSGLVIRAPKHLKNSMCSLRNKANISVIYY